MQYCKMHRFSPDDCLKDQRCREWGAEKWGRENIGDSWPLSLDRKCWLSPACAEAARSPHAGGPRPERTCLVCHLVALLSGLFICQLLIVQIFFCKSVFIIQQMKRVGMLSPWQLLNLEFAEEPRVEENPTSTEEGVWKVGGEGLLTIGSNFLSLSYLGKVM